MKTCVAFHALHNKSAEDTIDGGNGKNKKRLVQDTSANDVMNDGNSKKMKTYASKKSSQTTNDDVVNSEKETKYAPFYTSHSSPTTRKSARDTIDDDDGNSRTMETLVPFNSLHSSTTSVSHEVCSDFRFLFDDVPFNNPKELENENATQIQRNNSLSDALEEMPWSMQQQDVHDDFFD